MSDKQIELLRRLFANSASSLKLIDEAVSLESQENLINISRLMFVGGLYKSYEERNVLDKTVLEHAGRKWTGQEVIDAIDMPTPEGLAIYEIMLEDRIKRKDSQPIP